MRVFLTGATGFIGSRVLQELLGAGHQVLGLTRSDTGERWLEEAGATAHRGTLEDIDSLARGAAQADAVIHTAFDHDFSRFAENCEKDRRVIGAMAEALVGSDRPLIITSSTGIGNTSPGQPAVEQAVDWSHALPRIAGERAGVEAANKGVSVTVVRLPRCIIPRSRVSSRRSLRLAEPRACRPMCVTEPIDGQRYMSTMLRGCIDWPSSVTRPAPGTMQSQRRESACVKSPKSLELD